MEGQADRGGAAVGATAGAFDLFAAMQEGFELFAGQGVAGFDGGLAGHHVEHLVQSGLVSGVVAFFVSRELEFSLGGAIEQLRHELDGIDVAIKEEGGKGVDGHAGGAHRFTHDADAGEQRLE